MTDTLHLAGIGIGPFNLSIAALLDGLDTSARFFDGKPEFSWHPDLLLPGASLQTSFLKDLVTPVAPTNPHSFLAYLVAHQRFYAFLNAEQRAVSRQEYADYFSWVSKRLSSLQFASAVSDVQFKRDHFVLQVGERQVRARNISVGTGRRPHVPTCCQPHISADCFHALEIGRRQPDLRGKRVAVIGGGQTGAEIVLNLLNQQWGRCQQVVWLTRRPNLQPLDETPFTNEFFTPEYVSAFQHLPWQRRQRLVAEQKLASDGISPETLTQLYQRLYRQRYLDGDAEFLQLLPNRELVGLTRDQDFALTVHNALHGDRRQCHVDVIILCTGLADGLPTCLQTLSDHFEFDEQGRPRLDAQFRVGWDGPRHNRIYLLNAGRYSHGVAEQQLSLMAWRSACVINDLLGEAIFDVRSGGLLDWQTPAVTEAVA